QSIVAKHSSQFRGNAQHDALEFLLWLLDRMHEDLGAASPAPQSRGPPEVGVPPRPGWGDVFGPGQGVRDVLGGGGLELAPAAVGMGMRIGMLFWSSLTCPHCLKQSNTFDPFLCISLPIPLRQTRALNVTLVLQCERWRFVRVGLAVPLLGTVADLREMVAREGRIPPEQVTGARRAGPGHHPGVLRVPGRPQVILAELSPRGFLRSLSDPEALAAAGEAGPVYAFQPPPARRAGTAPRPPLAAAAGAPRAHWLRAPGPRLLPSTARSSDCLHRAPGGRILLLLCNTAGTGPQLARFGPPLVLREERGISWEQLQQSILAQLRGVLRGEVRAQGTGALFRIRLAGSSAPCTYLSPQDPRPLCHPAIDRALQLSGAGGPPHVKLTAEWDTSTKERLFGSIQEEAVQDAESVRRQQQAHGQQHSCTLDECFQLYTKEEQVRAPPG
ncbi:UBP43 hydrolase, partial [Climacteris rufus]|nr:UBP43 hydrolase [Climacteris rufus]